MTSPEKPVGEILKHIFVSDTSSWTLPHVGLQSRVGQPSMQHESCPAFIRQRFMTLQQMVNTLTSFDTRALQLPREAISPPLSTFFLQIFTPVFLPFPPHTRQTKQAAPI